MASKKVKKEIRDWAIFAGILLTLYFTGLHTDVAAFAQRIVLATGVANPDIEIPKVKTRAAYDFTLDKLEGGSYDFEQLRGKIVFINFWATWCPPCIAEMPGIQSLYDVYKDNEDIVFVMISLDKNRNKAKKFIDKKGFTFPVFFPDKGGIPKVYESKGIPTTFVIDKEGIIAHRKVGMANYDAKTFIEYLRKLAE